MALVLKSKKTVEENKKSGGTRTDYFKPKPNANGVFKVFICPPKTEDTPLIQKVVVNEIFNSQGKVAGYVSPSNFEETDTIIKLGWTLRKKYANHKSKKVQDFWRQMVGKEKNIIYIIDPSNVEAGIQMFQAPNAIADFIINDIEQSETGDDISFCHPETGRLLVIKKTGEKLQTKYQCAWGKNDCNLDGIDEDKLEEMLSALPDSVLGTVFKKPTKQEIEDYKEALDKMAEKLNISINWKSIKDSNLEIDDDADTDDEEDADTEDEDEDLDTDEDMEDDEDLDIEDDEDEKPAKGKAKEAPKKSAKAPAGKKDTKTSSKTNGKSSSKKVLDDEEDDIDLSDDDLDLDEE